MAWGVGWSAPGGERTVLPLGGRQPLVSWLPLFPALLLPTAPPVTVLLAFKPRGAVITFFFSLCFRLVPERTHQLCPAYINRRATGSTLSATGGWGSGQGYRLTRGRWFTGTGVRVCNAWTLGDPQPRGSGRVGCGAVVAVHRFSLRDWPWGTRVL